MTSSRRSRRMAIVALVCCFLAGLVASMPAGETNSQTMSSSSSVSASFSSSSVQQSASASDLQKPNRNEDSVLKPVEETKANVEEESNVNSIQQQQSVRPAENRDPTGSGSTMMASLMALILSVVVTRLLA
ncbi:hypothetical protein GHT06_012221 [Daphnia sinensis]|uniref:Uncharacterized protein n=1 Tax=Daphnia sinensis TaxID=1820382 RepID=A0AAD5LEH6_9CRUS|nr:hypothetical protein GHT06_012221 [Daphnia sinensis]